MEPTSFWTAHRLVFHDSQFPDSPASSVPQLSISGLPNV